MAQPVATLAGRELPDFTVTVGREELRRFAVATSNGNAAYSDVEAARASGYPDLPLPPTYLFSLELRRPHPYALLDEIHVRRAQALHGEQSFRYLAMCFAGDTLTFTPRITDDYVRKGGALRFLVRQTTVTRAGTPIALLRNVLALRQVVPS
jgi:acyl dehydratase